MYAVLPQKCVRTVGYSKWQKISQSCQKDLVFQVMWEQWQGSWVPDSAGVGGGGKGFW